MLREFRRKIAGFLVMTMLVGQILQGQTLTSFAALASGRATPSETPSETEYVDGKILLQIKESDIQSAIRRGKNGADALKKDLIPFTGDAKEGVYRTLREAMEGRVLVRQERLGGENSSCMYLISVDKNAENESIPERVDVIVVNADLENDYNFLVQITGDELDIAEANVSRYDVDYEVDETEEEEEVVVPDGGLVYDGASDNTEIVIPNVITGGEPSDNIAENGASEETAGQDEETLTEESNEAGLSEEETGTSETVAEESEAAEDGTEASEDQTEAGSETDTEDESSAESEDETEEAAQDETSAEDSLEEETEAAAEEETETESEETEADVEEETEADVQEEEASDNEDEEEILTTGQIRITRHEVPLVAAPEENEIIDEEEILNDEEILDEEIADDEEILDDEDEIYDEEDEIVDEEILDEENYEEDLDEGLRDFFSYTGVVLSDGEDEEILNEMSIEPVSDPEELTEDDVQALLGKKASDESQIMDTATRTSLLSRMFSSAKRTQVIGYNLLVSGGITVLSAKTGEPQTVYDYAEDIYEENTEGEQSLVTARVSVSDGRTDGSSVEIKAGESLTFTVTYTPLTPPTFGETGEAKRDIYEAITNVFLTLRLPAGIALNDGEYTSKTEGNGYTDYIIERPDITNLSADSQFTIGGYVEGNGTAAIGNTYTFDPQDCQFTGTVKIVDLNNNRQPEEGQKSEYIITSSMDYSISAGAEPQPYEYTTVTDDEWGITKELIGDSSSGLDYEIKDVNGQKAVVFTYRITLGLINENGEILSQSANYARPGRTPFSDFLITDTLSAEGKNGDVDPLSFEIYQLENGTVPEDPIEEGTESVLNINQYDRRGFHGSNEFDVDDSAPYYTQYQIVVAYPYDAFEIDFWDMANTDDNFPVSNTAQLTYTLSGGSQDTDEDSAGSTVKFLRSTKVLKIKKQIQIPQDMNNGFQTVLYDASWGDRFTGYAQFQIQKQNEDGTYELYDNAYLKINTAEGEEYRLLEDGRPWINPVMQDGEEELVVTGADDGTITLYVEPGVYQITEIEEPKGTAQLDGSEGGNLQSSAVVDLSENDEGTATITNKAPKLGGVQFKKEDGSGKGLAGAEFGIWKADETDSDPVMTVTSSADGTVRFYPLAEGNYVVREMKAPAAYILDEKSYQVSVEGNTITGLSTENVVVNTKNEASLRVTKLVQEADGIYKSISSYPAAIDDFKEAFTIQKRLKGSSSEEDWQNVNNTGLSLNTEGQIQLMVEQYQLGTNGENEGEWEYRVIEKVPDGYTSMTRVGSGETTLQTYDEAGGTVTTKAYSFINGSNGSSSIVISVVNRPLGQLKLTKQTTGINVNGQQYRIPAEGKIFWLYATDSEGKYVRQSVDVNGAKVDFWETSKDGVIDVAGLPVYDEAGNLKQYYWYEASEGDDTILYGGSSSGSVIDATEIKVTENDEDKTISVIGPFTAVPFVEKNVATVYAYNQEQKYPLWIEKLNGLTDKPLDGAKFTIYEADETGAPILENPVFTGEIEGNQTTAVLLTTGKMYAIKETTTPAGYYGFQSDDGKDYITVDLTKNVVITPGTTADKTKEFPDGNKVTFENDPKPQLKVEKYLYKTGTGTAEPSKLTNITFDVYGTGDVASGIPEGTVEAVTIDGETYSWKGTITSGENDTISLDKGTYYLRERWTYNSNIISPDLYGSTDEDLAGAENIVKDSDGKNYWEVTLTDPSTTEELIITETIGNYENKGSVSLEKHHAWADANGNNIRLPNAEFILEKQVTTIGEDEQPITSWQSVGTYTAANGTLTISGQPIYDENGNKIQYRIRETKAPEGFDLDEGYFEFDLSEKETVDEGTRYSAAGKIEGTKDIIFYDNPQISLSVKKFGTDIYEGHYYESLYELPGVHLALLHVVTDENGTQTVRPVMEGEGENASPVVKTTSRDWAQVTFSGLSVDEIYYIAEVYWPGGNHTIPNEKQPLVDRVLGQENTTLADAKEALKEFVPVGVEEFESTYFFKKFTGTTGTEGDDARSISADEMEAGQTSYVLDSLVNEKDWVQFEINKTAGHYAVEVTEERYNQLDEEDRFTDGTKFYEITRPFTEDELKTLGHPNGARFELYSQELSDFQNEDGTWETIAFNSSDAELLGTYESGTLLDPDGQPIDGLLRTEIFNDTTKVYWLVEVKAPIGGYAMDKEKSTVAFLPISDEALNALTATEEYADNCTVTNYSTGIREQTIENYKLTGPGKYYYGALKLNKWLAVGSEAEGEYVPLGNVKFELRLKGYDDFVLSELTTGLENNQENLDDKDSLTASAMTGYLDYEEIKDDFVQYLQDKGLADNEEDAKKQAEGLFDYNEAESCYELDCVLVEVYAPQKVEMSHESYGVTLKFRDLNTESEESLSTFLYNDTYYYPTGDGADTKGHTRLVNRQVEQYPVTIYKYGYRATDDVLAALEEAGEEGIDADTALQTMGDDLPGKTALNGVTFVLERKNEDTGKYEAYEYDVDLDATEGGSSYFTTDGGRYTFASGLPQGEYRLRESSLGNNSGYYNMYPGGEGNVYKYFTVDSTGANVYVFNPELLDLEVTKTGLPGSDTIDAAGVTFTLEKIGAAAAPQEKAVGSGSITVQYNNLQPGNYELKETSGNSSFTNEYFDNYNGNVKKIVLGYQRVRVLEDDPEQGYYLEKLTDALDAVENNGLTLSSVTVVDPQLGGLRIIKTDAEEPETYLSDAVFSYAFAPFRDSDFETEEDGNKKLKSYSDLTDPSNMEGSDGVTAVADLTYGQSRTVTTGSDGTASVSGLVPGWYRISETTPPSGYGENSGYIYVAVTGDMAANDSGSYQYIEYNTQTVENYEKVHTTIQKVLDFGDLQLTEEERESTIPQAIIFDIFQADESSAAQGNIDFQAPKSIKTFGKTDGYFDTEGDHGAEWNEETNRLTTVEADLSKELPQLSGDQHYFLREQIKPEPATRQNWILTDITVRSGDESQKSDLSEHIHQIDFDSNPASFHNKQDVSIIVTNRIGMAQIEIKKVNSNNPGEGLAGATFAVYDSLTGGRPSGKIATAVTGEDGTAVINVWLGALTDNRDTVYVQEVTAPDHYVLNPEFVTLSLSPGERVSYKDSGYEDLTFENVPGIDITLTKYRDTYEELFESGRYTNPSNMIQGKDAVFDLYVREKGSDGIWTKVEEEGGITINPETGEVNNRGVVSWKGLPIVDLEYAIYEHEITSGEFEAYVLDSVYRMSEDGKPSGSPMEVIENAITQDSEDGEQQTKRLYFLGDGETLIQGAEYRFAAFNKPPTQVILAKQAVVEDENGNAPKAAFRITDITDPDNPQVVKERVTTGDNGNSYPGDNGKRETISERIPLKEGTYRIEEIEALTENYAIVKNDSRVIWQKTVKIPEDGDKFVFTDLKTEMDLNVRKTATSDRLQSLWWTDEQPLSFDIALTVKNSLPLKTFTLFDTGLTMVNENGADLKDQAYWNGKYYLTSVSIPVPQADNSYIADSDGKEYQVQSPSEISATVTLYDFAGNEIATENPITAVVKDAAADNGYWTINVSDYTEEMAAKFAVSYTDENLYEASNGNYSLGRNFVPGTLKADFIVLRQDYYRNGDGTEPEQVASVRNDANVNMTYDEYDHVGQMQEAAKADEAVDGVAAVDPPQVPTIDVTKSVLKNGQPVTSVSLEDKDELTYTLTLTNISDDVEVPMEDPIFLDILPGGLEVNGGIADLDIQAPEGVSLDEMNVSISSSGGVWYIYLPFKGNLEKGQNITVTYNAVVTDSVINNAADIVNNVYVTSEQTQTPFTDNQGGATFQVGQNNRWPVTYNAVDAVISQFNSDLRGNGWATAYQRINYSTSSDVSVLKEEMGDLDDAYVSGATSARASIEDGWVRYQLTVVNNMPNKDMGKLRIIDIIPTPGDSTFGSRSRGSEWTLNVADLETEENAFSVILKEADGKESDITADVTVYYTTSDDVAAYTTEFIYNELENEAWDGIWSPAYPSGERATAVAFDLGNTILDQNDRIVIQFLTNVQEFDGETEKEKAAFTYAYNNFSFRYEGIDENGQPTFNDIITSNTVNAILAPNTVQVGGKIWIDANGNGIQDESEQYLTEKVKELWDEGRFTIRLHKSGDVSGTDIYRGSFEDNSFIFDRLTPAKPKTSSSDSSLYTSDAEGVIKNILQTSRLRGNNPANFILSIVFNKGEDSDIIWNLTQTAMLESGGQNDDSGRSRIPTGEDLYHEDNRSETLDSNFYLSSSTEDRLTARSENFFLWNMGTDPDGNLYWDHTKDLGLVPYRNIQITKTDHDGNGLEGAVFTIYGPFADGEDLSADQSKLIGTYTSGEDGVVEDLPQLLYYQKYLLVEESPASGYTVKDAEAEGLTKVSVADDEAAWLIPNMAAVTGEDSSVNDITVTNRYDTGTLEFQKVDKTTKEDLSGAEFELVWSYEAEANDGMTEELALAAWNDFRAQFAAGEASPSEGIYDMDAPEADDENPNNGNRVTFKTDGSGPIRIGGLPYGSYKVKEIRQPEGYSAMIDAFEEEFVISKDQKEFPAAGEDALVFENTRQPYDLQIRKTDTYGTLPDGIQFKIEGPGTYREGWIFNSFNEEDDSARGLFTTEDGRIYVEGLAFGDYKITEIASGVYEEIDPFYIRIDRDGNISLLTDAGGAAELNEKAQGAEVNITVTNTPLTGSVALEKVDSERSTKKLAGAEFRLTGTSLIENGFAEYVKTVYGSGITVLSTGTEADPYISFRVDGTENIFGQTNGIGIITRLPYGTYTLTETKAPDGYVLGDTPWSVEFTIGESSQDIRFQNGHSEEGSVENDPHRLTVTKTSTDDEDKRLMNASFILQAADGRYVVLKDNSFDGWTDEERKATEITTGTDGTVTVYRLPAGTYTLLETESPIGYLINKDIPSFYVGDDHTAVIIADTPSGGDNPDPGPDPGPDPTPDPGPNPDPSPNPGGGNNNGGGNNGGGSSGGGGGSSDGGSSTTTIPDTDVPLANLPNSVISNPIVPIDDMEVPLGALPKTGDFLKNHGFMALITAALALILLIQGKKKEKSDGEEK